MAESGLAEVLAQMTIALTKLNKKIEEKKEVEEAKTVEKRERLVDTATSLRTFSGGSVAVAEERLQDVIQARKTGKWSEDYTKSVLFAKLVSPAKWWQSVRRNF